MDFIKLSPPHEDIVHDIAFDYYGKRFATCSSDKHIKIWSLSENNRSNSTSTSNDHVVNGDNTTGSNWVSYDIPRAHQYSIWRLCWADPEFGQLLASCSEDRHIYLWEENESTTGCFLNAGAGSITDGRWKRYLVDTLSKSVNAIKFSHRKLGLRIASVCSDGYLRVHAAEDIFDMNKWERIIEYLVEDTTSSTSTADRKESSSEHGLTCCSWNDCPFESDKIAVGGYSKVARVLSLNGSTMREECILGSHNSAITDIAWAPSMGRSYHMIATASRESSFKIHKLKRKDNNRLEYISTSEPAAGALRSNVCRVAWNATGTVLATSAEDGTLSLWRKNFNGEWVNVQNIASGLKTKMNYFHQSI